MRRGKEEGDVWDLAGEKQAECMGQMYRENLKNKGPKRNTFWNRIMSEVNLQTYKSNYFFGNLM